jgi:hypothetical protein
MALILVIPTTPALSAGVVVHDQVKFREAVK